MHTCTTQISYALFVLSQTFWHNFMLTIPCTKACSNKLGKIYFFFNYFGIDIPILSAIEAASCSVMSDCFSPLIKRQAVLRSALHRTPSPLNSSSSQC
mmetsp:Transcript_59719/g.69809  ORF Transcript_59719/g.69809 Transcript_59719/m.69809 type:complete len:98 (-) Transcript_59719:1182-1475(-)